MVIDEKWTEDGKSSFAYFERVDLTCFSIDFCLPSSNPNFDPSIDYMICQSVAQQDANL